MIPDMPTQALLVLALVIAGLVLIPTRRLFLAGFSTTALTAYYLIVVALGLFVAELRGPARYLIPILVIAYIAPFVTARDGIAHLRDRLTGDRGAASRPPDVSRTEPPARPGSRPMKNVTPREARPPDAQR